MAASRSRASRGSTAPRHGGVQLRATEAGEREAELARLAHVLQAEARVHQDEALSALDQQAMTHQARGGEQPSLAAEQAGAARAHGAAVEVMDRARSRVHRARPTPTPMPRSEEHTSEL